MRNVLHAAVAILGLSSTLASGMDFAFRPTSLMLGDSPQTRLVMSGEIRTGDALRLRRFLAANSLEYLSHSQVILDSPGGDLAEALQLAHVMREVLATALVAPPARCASACFFLYVGAPMHDAISGPNSGLAIHRPYFFATFTKQMSAAQADASHNAAFTKARQWLQDQFVPQALIDKLFSLPSSQAYLLNRSDIDSLGMNAPWYEEWIEAKCPGHAVAQQRYFATVGSLGREEANRAIAPYQRCELEAAYEEQEAVLKRYSAGALAIQ